MLKASSSFKKLRSKASMSQPNAHAGPRVYRFSAVELDLANHSVFVDGELRACSPKAFELLRTLCEAGDRVVGREELIARAWPGGQQVSDEALTQLIFRARAVLGGHGSLLVTLRGVGLRLNATVETIYTRSLNQPLGEKEGGTNPTLALTHQAATLPDPALATQRAAVAEVMKGKTGSETKAERRASRLSEPLAGLALLLIVLVASSWVISPAPGKIVDEGYGLRATDLKASRPDTALLISEALTHDSRGERPRAVELLSAIHEGDPSTPVPALFLALWAHGAGDKSIARDWLARAELRLRTDPSIYLNLLAKYIRAEVDLPPDRVISAAGAVLDLRPGAWRMHHARGHMFEFLGMRSAALAELRQIEIPALGHNKRDMALADRASLGDLAGARAVLDRLPADSAPLSHAYLSGRLAWSEGNFGAALGFFRAAAEQAREQARIDLLIASLKATAMLEVYFGRDHEAIAVLQRARNEAGDRSRIDAVDIALFLAELHAVNGDVARTEEELRLALAQTDGSAHSSIASVAQFVAVRLRRVPAATEPKILDGSMEALWAAAQAMAAGDRDQARNALRLAQQRGIDQHRLADEARWLAFQLGLEVVPQRVIDPPMAHSGRVVLRRQLRSAFPAAGQMGAPGP